MSSTGPLRNTDVDRLVLEYLRKRKWVKRSRIHPAKRRCMIQPSHPAAACLPLTPARLGCPPRVFPRSFKEAEKVLQLEMKEAVPEQEVLVQSWLGQGQGEAVVERLLFATAGGGDPAELAASFERLATWVDNSLDLYKVSGSWPGLPGTGRWGVCVLCSVWSGGVRPRACCGSPRILLHGWLCLLQQHCPALLLPLLRPTLVCPARCPCCAAGAVARAVPSLCPHIPGPHRVGRLRRGAAADGSAAVAVPGCRCRGLHSAGTGGGEGWGPSTRLRAPKPYRPPQRGAACPGRSCRQTAGLPSVPGPRIQLGHR
jgi:hypothetical protein